MFGWGVAIEPLQAADKEPPGVEGGGIWLLNDHVKQSPPLPPPHTGRHPPDTPTHHASEPSAVVSVALVGVSDCKKGGGGGRGSGGGAA